MTSLSIANAPAIKASKSDSLMMSMMFHHLGNTLMSTRDRQLRDALGGIVLAPLDQRGNFAPTQHSQAAIIPSDVFRVVPDELNTTCASFATAEFVTNCITKATDFVQALTDSDAQAPESWGVIATWDALGVIGYGVTDSQTAGFTGAIARMNFGNGHHGIVRWNSDGTDVSASATAHLEQSIGTGIVLSRSVPDAGISVDSDDFLRLEPASQLGVLYRAVVRQISSPTHL